MPYSRFDLFQPNDDRLCGKIGETGNPAMKYVFYVNALYGFPALKNTDELKSVIAKQRRGGDMYRAIRRMYCNTFDINQLGNLAYDP